ncbi:hypothetical protein [Floricoccus penangensis]|uniref:Uncharacterized protein n=1 Tax=Floricoccus penangensis TaxID=1859475 RepID=A0A9Q5P275_9LACT|nr:hypothetical protein [Floricoccus penangensis]OFI47882.1 hypothetical protein BG262_07775 [Floricoccus penangensis]URZ87816.1 hypothetical protein KIW23_01840 [Floricoccus penangensis]
MGENKIPVLNAGQLQLLISIIICLSIVVVSLILISQGKIGLGISGLVLSVASTTIAFNISEKLWSDEEIEE